MDNLRQIVREEVEWYAGSGRGAGLRLFTLLDDQHQTYAVNAIHVPKDDRGSGIVVLARIVGDKVVIEEDRTDRPLRMHLEQRGVPRENIVLAYAGETIPELENVK